ATSKQWNMGITQFFARKLMNYQSEKSLAFKMRKKRAERIKMLIVECYRKHGNVNIIDIGGSVLYWNIIPTSFLMENKVRISIVNLPSDMPFPEDDHIFSFQAGDGCNLVNIEDDSFHIAHSNSVIEHVGDDSRRIMFAHEFRRVARSYYLQTPNFWFPIEPHFAAPFFHWLPEQLRIKLISNFDLGYYNKAKNYQEAKEVVDSCNLLSMGELSTLFPKAVIHKEKIALFTKSLVLIEHKAA
ncbi:MAG: hypothetical protein KDC01_09345, partial [Flavobacteriales bacterium]|nr:hypothetical protein [Flavobacteriales bacterium]